jgi:Raf kinase inhibitor-like YbhB/YbcL family protein
MPILVAGEAPSWDILVRVARPVSLLGLVVLVALAGCGGGGSTTLPTATTGRTISVHSSAFAAGGAIPADYGCDGTAATPPALSWSGVPANAKALAVVVADPDANGFVHWLVTGLPPTTTSLDGRLPAGAVEGENSYGTKGWAPMCPPEGKGTHRYRFAVYALDAPIDPGADDELGLIQRHAIASGTLTGTFSR